MLQDAQQGGRPLGTASHRSQSIRPPLDLYEEAGRPGVRRKAVRVQSRQQGLQDLQPSQGHGREKSQRDLLETPAYSLPLGVTSEHYHYEGDVLRFTSALDGPLLAEDSFDGEDFCSAMEQETRVQRLRQEIRRLGRMNATYRELPTSPQPLSASPGIALDNSGVASPSIVPGTTGEPEDASPGAAPTAPTTPAAGNAPKSITNRAAS